MLDIEGFREYLYEEELSEKTIESYMFAVNDYFSKYSEITKANLISWKQELAKEHSPRTVNLRLCGINKYCGFAELPLKVKKIKVQRSSSVDNVITAEQYEKLINCLHGSGNLYWEAYIKILARMGARISEALQFTKADLEKGCCELYTKGKVRKILFPQGLVDEVSPLFKTLAPQDRIFRTNRSKPITSRGVSQHLLYLAERYGIPKEVMHPHSFRHFFAIEFCKRNQNIALLADLLGHSGVNVTQVYLRMSQEQQKDAVDNIVDW